MVIQRIFNNYNKPVKKFSNDFTNSYTTSPEWLFKEPQDKVIYKPSRFFEELYCYTKNPKWLFKEPLDKVVYKTSRFFQELCCYTKNPEWLFKEP